MTRKQKYILLIILTAICGTIVFFQYKTQKDKHERLATFGLETPITVKHSSSWGVNYVYYFFVTLKGQKIEGTEKCGRDFNKYINATAIYNPIKPTEYDFSFDFSSYYTPWRIMFFFFIYLPVMTFVTYSFINFGVTSYFKLKG